MLWLLTYGTARVKPSELMPVAEQVDGFDFGRARDAAGKAGVLSKALKQRRGTRWNEHRDNGKVVDALTLCMDQNTRTGRYEYSLQHVDGKERRPPRTVAGSLFRLDDLSAAPSPQVKPS
jgi:hypothetical protein